MHAASGRSLDAQVREDVATVLDQEALRARPSEWCAAYDRLRGYQRQHLRTKALFLGSYIALAIMSASVLVRELPELLIPIVSIAFIVGIHFVDEAADAFFRDRTRLERDTIPSLLIVVDRWRTERQRLGR